MVTNRSGGLASMKYFMSQTNWHQGFFVAWISFQSDLGLSFIMRWFQSTVLLLVFTCWQTTPGRAYPPPQQQLKHHWLKELSLKGVNGGTTCAACTVLTGLVAQLVEVHNASTAEALGMLCSFLPDQFQDLCKDVVETVGPALIQLLEDKATPDMACHAIRLCKNDMGQFCHLFPLPKHSSDQDISISVMSARKSVSDFLTAKPNLSELLHDAVSIHFCDIFKPLCDALKNHMPLKDSDADLFSTMGTLRGYYWRGMDCDDENKDIYPGRRTSNDANVDTNCNGIMGVDPAANLTYESLWCEGTHQMGTVVLGDSASAHFHIPPTWFNATGMNKNTFKDMPFILENEFDWPMLSSVTGFESTSTWSNSISGKVDSNYLRLLEINRCNHRDYQNIAVNGASASSMAEDIVTSFARHGPTDNPVFLTLALIGNDVCNRHPSMDHMTKPEDFYSNMVKTLQFLDQQLAPGSVVIAMGLVDGRVLYDALSKHIHPFGSLHQDVTYSDFYNYMNCLEVSPCFGWLNSNEIWRNMTTQRAMELNKALQDAIAKFSFTNFKVFYIDHPLPGAIYKRIKEGRRAWELLEPVDGFHPSQTGQALTTELTFQILAKMGVLPKTNPFNDKIKEKFGDQGGYV